MTYVKPAEYAFLSPTGHWAAVLDGKLLYLVQTKDGSTTRLELLRRANLAALDSADRYLVVAGPEWLAVQEIARPGQWLVEVEAPANLYQLKLAENGWLYGISYSEKAQVSYLQTWQLPNLKPLWDAPGQPLGPLFVQSLYPSPQQPYFLHQGVKAFTQRYPVPGGDWLEVPDFDRALQGVGQGYCRLTAFNEKGLVDLWLGERLDFTPNGLVMPAADEGWGVYDLEKLVVFQARLPLYQDWEPTKSYPLPGQGEGAILVSSPDGHYLAALYGRLENGTARHYLEISQGTGKLAANTFTYINQSRASFAHLGHFPTLAVDRQGQATLVFSDQPGQLQLLRLKLADSGLTTFTVHLN